MAEFGPMAQSAATFTWLWANGRRIFFEGQVREIPLSTQWEQAKYVGCENPLVSGWHPSRAAMATAATYQNGGYWATPLHHVLPFIAVHDRPWACRLRADAISS